MHQLFWFAIAWTAGTALILGSLMTLGSLILWAVPGQPSKRPQSKEHSSGVSAPPWQNRLKLTTFSLAIALIGLWLMIFIPFPEAQ